MGQTKIKSKVIIVKDETDLTAIKELEKYIAEGYAILDATAMHVATGSTAWIAGAVIYTLKHVEVSV